MIKKRDGTPFVLEGPNPLMQGQSLWRDGKFTLHNCKWQPVVIEDRRKGVKQPTTRQPKVQLAEPPPVPEVVEQLPTPEQNPDAVQVWCLPAKMVSRTDPLYGEAYKQVKYGQKFMFEAVIIDQQDLYIVMWTNTKAVTEGSVVYPRTKDVRWWKVTKVEPREEGYLVTGMITDQSPDFSS